jgi:hypothetical protein
MTSKEQAKVVGESLVAAAEAEQERAAERNTLPLVRIYPELKHVPPLERHAVLHVARDFAASYVSSRVSMMLILLAVAALVALVLTGHMRLAGAAGCLALLLFFCRQFIERRLIRRYLRQSQDQA